MKRRISLAIAFALSLLMMFSSIASAEEMNDQITVTASQPTELEVVQVPPTKTKKADFPPRQAKVIERVLKKEEQSDDVRTQGCNLECKGGRWGYWDVDNRVCVPC